MTWIETEAVQVTPIGPALPECEPGDDSPMTICHLVVARRQHLQSPETLRLRRSCIWLRFRRAGILPSMTEFVRNDNDICDVFAKFCSISGGGQFLKLAVTPIIG